MKHVAKIVTLVKKDNQRLDMSGDVNDDALSSSVQVNSIIRRELNEPSSKKSKRSPFIPTEYGLREDFRLTDFSALKG